MRGRIQGAASRLGSGLRQGRAVWGGQSCREQKAAMKTFPATSRKQAER